MSKYKEITKGGKFLKLGSHYVRGLESGEPTTKLPIFIAKFS
jgi:hypothetical protein